MSRLSKPRDHQTHFTTHTGISSRYAYFTSPHVPAAESRTLRIRVLRGVEPTENVLPFGQEGEQIS